MTASLPTRVRLLEVGPRDGLQNESIPVPTDAKARFITKLAGAGMPAIEATSFVRPDRIPQLSDAVELLAQLPPLGGTTLSALVPNQKGLDRAIEAGVSRVAVFTAASNTFTQRNINMTIDESLDRFGPVIRGALDAGMTVRGYVSTSFVCPYEGDVPRERVRSVAEQLADMGCDTIAISDTIGAAAPSDVQRTLEHVFERVPVERIALHLHDTYGTALVNAYAGLEMGVTEFDASAGGLGGCPYAPGAAGNLATEDLVYMLDRLGIETGVDLDGVIAAVSEVAGIIQREPTSRLYTLRRSQARDAGARDA